MRELDVFRQTAAGVAALHELEAVNGELLHSQATLRAANSALAEQQNRTSVQLQRTSRRLELSDGLLEPALGTMRRMQREAAEAAAQRARLARASEEEAKLRAKVARLALQAHAGLVSIHETLARLAGSSIGLLEGPEDSIWVRPSPHSSCDAMYSRWLLSQTACQTRESG